MTRSLLDALTERALGGIAERDTLTEADVWDTHGPTVWRARRFEGAPSFYPVYRFEDLYSHSPLLLLLAKGRLRPNARALDDARRPGFWFHSGHDTIDADIERLGAPHPWEPRIHDPDTYADRIAAALRADVAAAEARHPGYVNVVLCGGKDSLNLLLLPWRNPTIVASAEPNHPWVRRFAADNDLPYPVLRLGDPADDDELRHEVLENACRADLGHWRWGAGLRRIARDHDARVIFWKGQLADLYTTDKWKAFMHPVRRPAELSRKVYKRLRPVLPSSISHAVGRRLQPSVVRATWDRCAMLQGGHMGFIRELTDALVLSAYHGPAMTRVWREVDLGGAAQTDMRDRIGMRLKGGPVRYPDRNPTPPPSAFRQGLHNPERLLGLLREGGFPIGRPS